VSCESRDGAKDYRRRMYGSYVTGRNHELVPSNIQGLRPRAAHLNKLIQSYFPEDRSATIIDLGCGHGALIHFARAAGYRNIVGIDRSPEQIEAARRLRIDGVRQGDLIEAISSIGDSSIDAVITFDVIEHFRKDELSGFVDEVIRVLRAGGRWIIHAPNGESPFGSRMRYWDFTHEMAFTRESVSQLLIASGFARVDCYEDTPVVHGMASAVRWVLWKGIRAAWRLWMAVETGETGGAAIFSQNLFAIAFK
jgi:2-polyprenyl-3-methyl-5-hydroxy-6-metoxy-1,4-benzoquinol methylase